MSFSLVLLGPTAVGKSHLALSIAEKFKAPIISVDSRQSYKKLDIGTAKPSPEEQEAVRHLNIDVKDPSEHDDVQQFLNRCKKYSENTPLAFYCGGSTLHLQGVLFGFDPLPSADKSYITSLEKRIKENGLEDLYTELQQKDPTYTSEMDGMNRQRIIRALDVIHQTNRPFSSFHTTNFTQKPENALVVGLTRERQKLYERINQRVDEMFVRGLEEEVRSLLNQNYTFDMPGMKTVGYREFELFLEEVKSGDLSENHKKEIAEKIKTQTRRYAKRQMTWFRRWPFISWFHPGQKEEIMDYIRSEIPSNQTKLF